MFKLQKICKAAILCFTALVCAAASAQEKQQEKRAVAVLEPFTEGPVTSLNKSAVRGAINTFLVNTGTYRVVDRARTEQILSEQSFQRSQLSDSNKAKQLGKLLGADLICFSELIKEEGYFNAELNIIDVEIGEVTNSGYKLIARDDPISIDGAIREAMAELLGIKIDPPKQEAPQARVESRPNQGAAQSAGRSGGSQKQRLTDWGDISQLKEDIIVAIWDGHNSSYSARGIKRNDFEIEVDLSLVIVKETAKSGTYSVDGYIRAKMVNLINGKQHSEQLYLTQFMDTDIDIIKAKILEQVGRHRGDSFALLYRNVR